MPFFFQHEPVVIDWLDRAVPELAPDLIGHDDEGRMLLADIAGEDFYDAPLDVRLRLGDLAHGIQLASVDATSDLVAAGVPDRRGPAQAAWIREHLEPWVNGHPAEALLDDLDDRIDELDGAGCPTRSCTATSTRATSAATRRAPCSSTGATRSSATRSSTSRG